MIDDLVVGTLIVSATVIAHTAGLMAVTAIMSHWRPLLRLHTHDLGRTIAIVLTVLGLLIVHTAEIWFWAILFIALGALSGMEEALYFSTTTFSTIGYGDVVLPHDWRLLGSLEGMSGLVLIGWSTAYLVAASSRHGPLRIGEHFER